MNKLIMAGIAGLALASSAANAIGISGEVGKKYTNVGVGFGTESSGLAVTANYAHNDDKGDVAGLGLGFNVPLGPFMGTVGGKGLYLNPKDGDEGYAVAVGGGLKLPVSDSFSIFGNYYYSPDSLSSGVKDYQEASAGVNWTIMRPVTLTGGYRYIGLKGKNGDRDKSIADGPYVGVSASF